MNEDKPQSPKGKLKQRLLLDEEYRVLSSLGTGGMAEVYRAEQVSLNRTVAIKKLKSSLGQNPEMLERFYREGKSTANLQHENIVQVYQMGKAGEEYYIVMEYVEGKDLKSILKVSGPISWQIAGLIIQEVAKGLGFAHQRGYIHRDIKPGNIMVSQRGEVKIMDFGIVRRIDSELTKTGAFLGTPSYMSPEQLKGENITPGSDLFSLGVVFYEILAGEKPFRAETEPSLIHKIVNEKPKSIRKLNPGVPWRMARIIKRLLNKNPKKRFESAEELAKALEKMLGRAIISRAEAEIAVYLAGIGELGQEEKTRRVKDYAGKESEELVQVEPLKKGRKTSRKTQASKAQSSLRVKSEQNSIEEAKWMLKTIILMAVSLGLILIIYFLNASGVISKLIKLFRHYF